MPSWPDGIEGMAWDRPGFLLLLPIALLLIFLAERRSLVTWTRRQAIFCRILRVAVVALIVLALAGPRSVHTSDKVAVIFLRDVSDSISLPVSRDAAATVAAARSGEENRSAEILFAREPVVLQPFGQPPLDPAPARPAADASDLSSALEFAAALLPPDQAGRIVLLSDGVVTAGRDPLVSAASLAERGVEIDTIPCLPPPCRRRR